MRSFTPSPSPHRLSLPVLRFAGIQILKAAEEGKKSEARIKKTSVSMLSSQLFSKNKVSTPPSDLTGLLDAPAVLPTRSPDVKLTSRAIPGHIILHIYPYVLP